MDKINERFVRIVKILYEKERICTLEELANELVVSSKTISRSVKMYQDDSKLIEEFGFFVKTTSGVGYKIEIVDNKKFNLFKKDYLITSNHQSVINYDNREKEIIKILLTNNDYMTIQTIADTLYVSESSIAMDLKNVKKLLNMYDISIIHKSSKGIKLDGSEMNIRLCYSKYFYDDENELNFTKDDYDFVEGVLLKIFHEYRINISEINRKHLLSHIFISLIRINQANYISFDSYEKYKIKEKKQYVIAEEIFKQLETRYKGVNREEEIIYLTIQLLGKQTLSNSKIDYELPNDIKLMLYEIFHEIKEEFDIDLTSDEEVFNYLAMHFEPMLTRLKYGIKSNNPFVNKVKGQHPMSFDMGLLAKKIIIKHYKYELDDNEVGYLAMYFSLALDKLKYIKKKKNILVVCGLGACSSRILVYKLRQTYGQYINDIVTCQYHELVHISMKPFDCIISTIKKPIGTKKAVIYIDDFLDDIQNQELNDFLLNNEYKQFDIRRYLKEDNFLYKDSFKNEEEAINYIIDKVNCDKDTKIDLRKNVLERENLSSTSFGNLCAIPHPVKMCTEDTIFIVVVLNKAMVWGSHKVKYIFFLSPSISRPSDLRFFNETLAKFIYDKEKFVKFKKEPTYQELMSIFKS